MKDFDNNIMLKARLSFELLKFFFNYYLFREELFIEYLQKTA